MSFLSSSIFHNECPYWAQTTMLMSCHGPPGLHSLVVRMHTHLDVKGKKYDNTQNAWILSAILSCQCLSFGVRSLRDTVLKNEDDVEVPKVRSNWQDGRPFSSLIFAGIRSELLIDIDFVRAAT
jgi:hypothetical protein